MTQSKVTMIRAISGAVLVLLVVAYAWITLRTDGRMRTIPFLPYWMTYHLEFYTMERNALAFGVLAMFGAGAVAGLRLEWQVMSFALCLAAPWVKDFAQIFILTRHFNWTATTWGIGGALVGWLATAALLRRRVAT
ncbi:MAG: hypothetical protein ACO3XN_05055 [Chthoniobacterales bacterium]